MLAINHKVNDFCVKWEEIKFILIRLLCGLMIRIDVLVEGLYETYSFASEPFNASRKSCTVLGLKYSSLNSSFSIHWNLFWWKSVMNYEISFSQNSYLPIIFLMSSFYKPILNCDDMLVAFHVQLIYFSIYFFVK